MYGNAISQEHVDHNENQETSYPTEKTELFNMVIPKVEPCSSDTYDTYEDTLNHDQLMVSPIPFTTPYKIKDPIVLLERCDKIWETLKLIKNVQTDKTSSDTFAALSSGITNPSAYIKYQPVLGNDNASLPNFKFSVISKKKLYQCSTCGRQYSENRTLRHHSEKVHGIYIPLKRLHSNMVLKNINGSKEPNEVEKEKISNEKPQIKKTENKQLTDSLPQSVSLQVTESHTISSPSRKRRKRSISIRSSNNHTPSKTVTNEQEEEPLSKRSKQNEKSNSPDRSLPPRCVLCKRFVKDMKTHFIDYHKIQSSDFMLKEMEKTTTVAKDEQLQKQTLDSNSCDKNEIPEKKSYDKKRKRRTHFFQRKKHIRATETQECALVVSNTRQCDICLGNYSRKNFNKHARNHVVRGETKENFHLLNTRYTKSPLSLKWKTTENSLQVTPKDTNNCHNTERNSSNSQTQLQEEAEEAEEEEEEEEEEEADEDENELEDGSSMRTSGKLETICSCGRVFRNPHTLFIHKAKCNLANKEEKQLRSRMKLNDLNESVSGNIWDKDSGIGISITIKKKNNSYEVVGKNNNNENELQDHKYLKDTDALSDISTESFRADSRVEQQTENLELSKYSKNHRILKLQLAEEDMDIDIEEDSQSSMCNNNIKEKLKYTFKQGQHKKTELTNLNSDQRKLSNKDYNCICGSSFGTKQALEAHINECHLSSKLNCGYCKEIFCDLSAWLKHECTVKKGEMFVDLPLEVSCPHCDDMFNSYIAFDSHITRNHSDPLVPYQCFHCTKRFPHTSSRRSHYREAHGIPVCSICKIRCPNAMKHRHDAYHYGLGFPCHTCKKTYSRSYNLANHLFQVHPKNSIPFCTVCDSCHLSFVSIKEYNLHKEKGECNVSTRN